MLVRYLTLGSGYCLTDPTVNPLIGRADLGIPRTIPNYTETSGDVKPPGKIFFANFLSTVDGVRNMFRAGSLGPKKGQRKPSFDTPQFP